MAASRPSTATAREVAAAPSSAELGITGISTKSRGSDALEATPGGGGGGVVRALRSSTVPLPVASASATIAPPSAARTCATEVTAVGRGLHCGGRGVTCETWWTLIDERGENGSDGNNGRMENRKKNEQ